MSAIDLAADYLAVHAALNVTDDTPPGATVKCGVVGPGEVFWASCTRCAWWASDDDPNDFGYRTEAEATADADRHNATTTVHCLKGHRTP